MHLFRNSAFAVLALLALPACTRAGSLDGFNHPEHGGLKRAAFELQCPEKDLQTADLGGAIGVTGCGKRAVYKWVMGAGWVNNSASMEPTSGVSSDAADVSKR